jgi:GNAT superfamily N-acetyltransferase
MPFFADRNLARRLERAEADSNAKFVEARGRVFPDREVGWIEVAGAYAMFDGPDSPITQTFGLGLFESVTAEHLEAIETFFTERGAPTHHEVSPLAELELLTLFRERGYRPIEFSTVLCRPLAAEPEMDLGIEERIVVRPIEADEGEMWAEVSVKGWSEVPEIGPFLAELSLVSTQREDCLSLVAELEGRPIAVGAMTWHGGVALLAGACTIPEGRRQGAQQALLDYRLRYAARHGCDLAMVGTQPGSASQRNAERHGFRIAYTRVKWQKG